MAKTWNDLSQLPEFQNLSREEQERARGIFFDTQIAPQVDGASLPKARALYDEKTLNRTWGEVATDTGKQLLEGGVNIINAIPSLVAPEWSGTKALDSAAQGLQDWQSPTMKAKIANANALIEKAGKEGLTAQAEEALLQYLKDPALASRLVTTNIASVIPGLGSAKLAQAASLARSAKAAGVAVDALGAAEKAKAAKMALLAGGVTNSALNAGGARGEAYKDLYDTAIQQGYNEDDAQRIALEKSRLPAVVGAVTGAPAGMSGLESGLFGRIAGKSAIGEGVKHFGTEVAGELAEEALPQVATNWQASEYDQRPLTKDIGRTLVETALATGPNATVAGVSAGLRHGAAPTPETPPAGEAPVDSVAPAAPTPASPPTVDAATGETTPAPIPVVGPLSEAAQAGQDAAAAGAHPLPQAPVVDPAISQKEAEALKQQQQDALQQHDEQMRALKLRQEQLRVNQQEQKLGLGPTQFDEPALLSQANDLASKSLPTIDQPQQEISNALQDQAQGPSPASEPAPAQDPLSQLGRTATAPEVQGQPGATINPNFTDQQHVDAFNTANDAINAQGGERLARPRVRLATPKDLHTSGRIARKLASTIAAGFGHRVIYVASENPQETLTFDGAISPHDPTTIFLAHDSESPVNRVVSHEVLHGLRRIAPDVYANMLSGLRQIYDPESVAKHAEQRGYLGGLTDANEEEWVADLFSNTLHTPKALARLALAMDHKVLGSGLMFLNNVKAFINALHGRLLGSPHMQGADNALADLEAARDVVTLGIVNYSRYRLTGQTNEDLGTVPLSLRSSSAPTKIKNPPLESKNEVTDVYNRETVSARAPTAKGATEDPVTQKLGLGLKTYLRAENLLPGAVETLSSYPQLRPTNRKVTLARRINDFINVIQSNLLWLHDKVPDTIRERSKLWYDGALKITERSSELYGVTKRQFAAVLATQSPQKDWFENVSLAERITSIFKRFQGHTWDDKMTGASARVLKQEELAEMSEGVGDELDVDAAPITPSKFIAGKARGMVRRSNGGLTYEQALAKATAAQDEKNRKNQARLDKIKGKRLDELYDDLDIAMWVRVFDAAHHSPHYSVVSPEGNFVGTRTGKKGAPTRIRWGTFAAVAKSISVLKDGSIENISQRLGAEHKIRNFYNNIIAPNDPAGYVTMDTHAIAADMVSPFSGNSEPVAHNFGMRGVPGSSVYGMSGTYPIHGEGYTRAAAERGVLPREMQSITWEAIRGLFTAPFKASKATGPNGVTHTAAINAMWGAYRNGSKTIDETRQEILDYVKKVTNRTEEEIFTPEWARSPSEVASKTSYEELHGMPKPAAPTNTAWSGMNVEVAPNPDQLKEAATDTLAKWSKLSDKERGQITELVGTPIIKQTMARLGISQYRIENTIGGFEKDANPSITIHFGPEVSWNQLEEATRVLGYLFKQKQMVLYDETDTTSKEDQVSFVQFKPTRKLSNEEIADLYVKVHAAFPDVGGMSVSNGSLSFANFSGTPDEEFGTKLRDVVHTYLKDKDYGVERINHRFRSVLLGDIVGQDAAGNDIIQTTLRGTRYDDETKTTEMGGEDGRSTIGKRSFTRGEALRWKRDFRDVQTSFDQRLEREVRHSYDRLRQESRAAKAAGLAAAPASLRSDAGGQERARGRTATQGSPVYGKATPGSVQGIGVHYSREERSSLDSGKFGTGIKGREAARVAAATDPRLRNRVYFYINDGKGIHPEQGLGGYAHTVNLQNLYDLDADPKYLAKQDANATESAILDAGYDGYVADFGAQRAAVLLGARQVPVRYVGRAITPEVPVGQRAVQNPIKQVASILKTPWQKRTPAAFGEMLKEKSPELYAQFGNQLTGTGDTYWPGDMARKLVTPDTVDATPADVAAWSQAVPMSIRTKPAPRKTVIAYKLFRLDPKRPGELFPLFVKMGNNAGIPMGIWQDAEEGEPSTTLGKVKSLLGPLAFRPGWHAGDLPIATHIGGERDKATGKPTVRLLNQVWAEVELAADVDWQAEANSRGKTARDKAITDQVPVDGFYRYKTNPNMTGNWLIGGSMKVNRLLSDAEVKRINDEAGTADLPRKEPLDLKKYGFDTEARFSNRSGLFLSPQRIDYEREARREGSDADRELVQSRLDSAVEEMGIEYPQKFSVMREEGPHFGLNLWRTGDAISTTKQGINNALSKGRGGASLYGQYAYPLYESEAAYLQSAGLRPFFAEGGWWYDAVSTIQGAYMGHGGLKGLPQEIGTTLRRVDRRTPDVWEVEHMPLPRTDTEYPARKRGTPRFSNRPNTPPEETRFRKAQRIVQDKFNRFRVIQDWLKKEGVNLTENADVYKAEERFHARVANQIEDFREQDLKPLIKRTQELQISMDDIAQFLHAQHAEERNDAVAKINPNFPDGGSGMDTAVARSILAAATPELRAIANEWRDITEKSLQMKVDSGLITQEMADAYHNKYQHYVPLKGGPEEQLVVGTGRGLKVRHKEKRALGHPLRQGGEWIIEQILEDREATIMKAEKALMAKHLLQMAVEMNRPDLISVEEPKKRQVLRQQNAYTVTYKGSPIETFQSLEAARVFRQFAGTQRGRSLIDFDTVKSTDPQVVLMASPMLADNETMAYVGGHEIRMQINDDLLARAYGNLGQEALGPILRAGRALNTYLSKAYTGYNPEFILTNMIRDFTTGIANLSGEQGLRVAGKAVKHYPRAFMDLLRSTRGPGHVSQSIQDYREDGGNTGAAYLDDLERIGTNVQQEYAKLQGVTQNLRDRNFKGAASAAVGKTLKPFIGWIEKLNQASENAMRLAIYQAMREAGLGRVKAASAAKNTTVNFNRKGEIGQAVNAWWLFFNASVQGTAALSHAHFKGEHKGQAWALSSTLVGIGYLASLAAASGGDDDEDKYEKLSDYERSRNLIIRTGDGFAKIPVPYGYGFMWNLGRTMADAQRTGKIDKAPWHLASNFAEEFTPFGSMVAGAQADSKQAVMFMGPTAWQAFAVPAFNLTSFGTPLYPEKSFQTAEFARDQMWRNTKGSWADELAGLLEKAGLDVSPETLKHLWRTGTGGAGTFATSLFDLGQMGVRGVSEFDAREIPFVRKVWTVPGVAEARSRYYTAVDETKVAEETFKRYKKKGDFEKADTYREENDALISLAKLSENNAKRIKRARDLYDSVKLDPNMTLPEKRQALRALEIEETQIYDDFMRTFNERTRVAPK